jgi:hypothetical protein
MFRIGIFELALSCGLIFLVIVIPIIVARYYARVDKRLKNIENKLDKKKE